MANSSNSRYTKSINPKTTAFFLCDVQEKFRPHIQYFEEIALASKCLIDAGKILQIPLVVTEQYPKGLGKTVAELDISHAVGVFSKTKFSMMVQEVDDLVKCGPIETVVLFGIEAHVCIQQTCLDLLSRNVSVHIIADATSSRSQMDRMFALERMKQAGAIITTSESVLLQLIGDKDHTNFKEIQKLIITKAPNTFPHLTGGKL